VVGGIPPLTGIVIDDNPFCAPVSAAHFGIDIKFVVIATPWQFLLPVVPNAATDMACRWSMMVEHILVALKRILWNVGGRTMPSPLTGLSE
jgi:hypothetical protein